MTRTLRIFLLGVLLVLPSGELFAESQGAPADQNRWGIGGFVDYQVPLFNLRDRYGQTGKYGFNLNYVASNLVTVEVEYHYSKFDNGKLASTPFTYPIDGRATPSPNASSTMTYNSLCVNALVFVGEENQQHGFQAKDYRHYLALGGGFFRYNDENRNLVWPAQTSSPIDLEEVMPSQIDKRTTIALTAGTGMEAFLVDNISLDVRARLNFVIGELRPRLFYGLERTRPLMSFDIGAGLKFYFWR